MGMNKPTADIITKKAIQAIKDAFASDPTLAGYAVFDNGGNFTGTTLDMSIRITDTVAINAVIGHQTVKDQLEVAFQISRYATREPESAADLTEESNDPRSHAPVTFKVDDVPTRVGNDMRVEYEDKEEGRTLIVVLTHEGIIMDVWDNGSDEPTATSSIMFNEKIEDMLDEQG